MYEHRATCTCAHTHIYIYTYKWDMFQGVHIYTITLRITDLFAGFGILLCCVYMCIYEKWARGFRSEILPKMP